MEVLEVVVVISVFAVRVIVFLLIEGMHDRIVEVVSRRSGNSHVVDDNVEHDKHSSSVDLSDEFVEVVFGSESEVDFVQTLLPVSRVAFTIGGPVGHVGHDW